MNNEVFSELSYEEARNQDVIVIDDGAFFDECDAIFGIEKNSNDGDDDANE